MNAVAIGGRFASVFQQATASVGARRRSQSGAPHPTGAPVRRDSREAGTFEDMFWFVPAKGETDKLLLTARRALDAGRRLRRDERAGARTLSVSERKITKLTAGAVRVFEEMLTLARLNQGKVFPSYDYLSEATSLGRRTVARSIRILEDVGFVLRQRRFKRVEEEGAKPRYVQTSNAYRPTLAQAVLAYLPRWMRPAPVPVDQLQRDAERHEDCQHMLSQLNCRELARATLSGPMGDALARLGARIDAQGASAETVLNR
ncbi:helix-turn-helix domain-containing protein [Sphingomonas sp. PP-CE-1G-424]|uniref:helix-turn-helix domain-containing protein n=1 Tax=Sphingomonas sp. PP-CE-1G-424 TaxID=2135658 RepID=UPI0010DCD955|nr:helix-turn-helix domain-containing protein [Sphingomonas sp. PP-CE-1G-424]TCP65687.1 helix-turn-helix protein [Sphingomonas sp. PP-CE-1G-424]